MIDCLDLRFGKSTVEDVNLIHQSVEGICYVPIPTDGNWRSEYSIAQVPMNGAESHQLSVEVQLCFYIVGAYLF